MEVGDSEVVITALVHDVGPDAGRRFLHHSFAGAKVERNVGASL